MDTRLRIAHGCGQPFELDASEVANYSGNVLQVLQRIAREKVRDPALLQTLQDPRVALDEFADGTGEEETAHEARLPRDTDWSSIMKKLTQTDVEVGVAVSHEGGMVPKGQ
jgi:hypothetical protein